MKKKNKEIEEEKEEMTKEEIMEAEKSLMDFMKRTGRGKDLLKSILIKGLKKG